MRISVCMITRNEAENLPKALASIPKSYEIIVVDTGSTDQTVEIVREFGANVYHMEWQDDFALARNEALAHATGDYIIVLDADELLEPSITERLQAYLMVHPHQPASVIIRNVVNGEETRHRMVRVFPNQPQYRFSGRVHEQLYNETQPADFEASDIEIVHYGYEDIEYDRKNKFSRYLALYEECLRENPQDGYMLYQLGKLYFSQNMYEEAYEAFVRSVELEQFDRLYYPPLLVQYGYTLKELKYSKQALNILFPFMERYPQYPDLAFLIGLLAMDAGGIDLIEWIFLRAIEIGETTKYSTVTGVGSYMPAYNLGVYYEVTNEAEKSWKYYREAASLGYMPAKIKLATKTN